MSDQIKKAADAMAADAAKLEANAPPIVKRNWKLMPYVLGAVAIGAVILIVVLAMHGNGGPAPHTPAG